MYISTNKMHKTVMFTIFLIKLEYIVSSDKI